MDIYISSSWKQRDRVRAVATKLRELGHEVYDFTDPACRNAPEIPPERVMSRFDPSVSTYQEYLSSTPEWKAAVDCNRDALNACDVVVLLLPCGLDAHADAFYGLGRGALLAVVGSPPMGERTPTHMWADVMLNDDGDIAGWLEGVQ